MFEPMAAPVRTIGASGPTEPPNPIVVAPPTTEVQQLWEAMYEFLRDMAYNTRVTPSEILSLTTYLTKSEARMIPMTG